LLLYTMLNALPPELWRSFFCVERFAFVAGVPLPSGAPEDDLFAGL